MGVCYQVFSSWQVVLVDLRCHGESAAHGSLSPLPNTVESAAADILDLLRELRLFPEALIGHSFGGKVVMSMADQFGRIGPRLPRPVQVRNFFSFLQSTSPALTRPVPSLLQPSCSQVMHVHLASPGLCTASVAAHRLISVQAGM
jgi:pimeloyl-ACP methyl ester carboxylesterase